MSRSVSRAMSRAASRVASRPSSRGDPDRSMSRMASRAVRYTDEAQLGEVCVLVCVQVYMCGVRMWACLGSGSDLLIKGH